jgi:hypothetical protein
METVTLRGENRGRCVWTVLEFLSFEMHYETPWLGTTARQHQNLEIRTNLRSLPLPEGHCQFWNLHKFSLSSWEIHGKTEQEREFVPLLNICQLAKSY